MLLPDISLPARQQQILLGHAQPLQKMCEAFDKGHLKPVWLLCGNRGIGKATFTYHLARYIFKASISEKIVEVQVSEGSYPNMLCLEKRVNDDGKVARDIPVDEARKVISFLKQTSAMPGARVLIIDSIDEMNRNAANALLKIIEEPPQDTYIFMICHALGHVLPTIKSRAMQLDIKPLSDQELTPLILEPFKAIIPVLAQGSVGKAVRLMQVDPIKLVTNLWQSVQQAASSRMSSLESFVSALTKNDTAYDLALEILPFLIHRLIAFGAITRLESPFLPQEQDIIKTLLQQKSMGHWIQAWQAIQAFLQQARISNLDKSHVLWAIYCIIEQPKAGATFVQNQYAW